MSNLNQPAEGGPARRATMRAMDSRLWAFVVVATLLAVTPGADTLLVVRNVLTRGRVAALLTVAGIAGG